MSIIDTVKTTASRTGLVLQKYAPEILTGVGIVGGVGAAVLGAKATLRLEEIVDTLKFDVNDLRTDELTEEELNKAKAKLYLKATLDIAKLYAPAVSLGLASIASILAGHGIMRRRNAALIAAYGVLEKAFDDYRERVREAIGEDKERELYSGYRKVEQINEETGKSKKVVELDKHGLSPYARIFNKQNSTQWDETPEYNVITLNAQQRYANERLKAKGHVFLNDVYDALGFERTREGAVVGWIKDGDGDNEVDFGMGNMDNIRSGAFINGVEGEILLDFNVDGVIWDKI